MFGKKEEKRFCDKATTECVTIIVYETSLIKTLWSEIFAKRKRVKVSKIPKKTRQNIQLGISYKTR